jgi:hypothetical protein
MPITPYFIKPHLFKQFGNIQEASGFFLILDPQYQNAFKIDHTCNGYSKYKIIYSKAVEIESVIAQIPDFSHILIIAPRFVSIFSSLKHKILCLVTESTNMDLTDVVETIKIMEYTDIIVQENWIKHFLSLLAENQKLNVIDPYSKTEAGFILSEGNEVGIMGGLMDWGDCWASVSGECGFFPNNSINDPHNINLLFNGEVTLLGTPVVSRINEAHLGEQQAIFNDLNNLKNGSVVLSIKQGKIQDIISSDYSSKKAAHRIEELLKANDFYSVLIEIAFGINTNMEMLPGNKLINEMYGGNNGCFHIGIGHQSWSDYHIDFICPRSKCYIGNQLVAG